MARTGGSRSGARVGGGHSSGSRSGGFHSSPSRGTGSRPRPSSGTGFGGSRHRGFVPPPPPPPRRTPGYRPRRTRRNGSCLGSILAFIIVLVVIVMVFGFARNNTGPDPQPAIQKEAVQRTPLSGSLCTETDYFTDEQGLISSQSQLLTGLKSFYTTTGVQPYVYITATENLNDAYADSVYDQLFTDEGHFLLLIHNTYDSQGNENWDAYYLLGSDAANVIDADLMEQFWQYYDRNYADTSLTTEQVLSQSFAQAASVFTTEENTTAAAPAPEQQSGSRGTVVLIIVVVLFLLIIGIIFMIVRSRKSKTSGNTADRQPDIFTQMNDPNHQD